MLSIRKRFPVNPPEFYDCVCGPPGNSSDSPLDWAKYSKPQCVVSVADCNYQIKKTLNIIYFQKYGGELIGPDCDLPPYEPNVFLMSLILFLGTFVTSVVLKDFKNALFFPSKVLKEICKLLQLKKNLFKI